MRISDWSSDVCSSDLLLEDYGFFAKDVVPEGTYADVGETETISVAAQWVTSAEQPEELVYNIVKVMWNDATRKSLDAGHAKGKLITPENATTGPGIPLHPGPEHVSKNGRAAWRESVWQIE